MDEINELATQYRKDNSDKTYKKWELALKNFRYEISFEKIPYAYQIVKERKRLGIPNA